MGRSCYVRKGGMVTRKKGEVYYEHVRGEGGRSLRNV